MSDTHLLALDQVSFSYNAQETILKQVDFTLDKGDYTAVVGTSGSGKSTLLSILGLLNQPTQGRYLVMGHDSAQLTNESIAQLKTYEIGFIYQNFNLLNHMKVMDNVALPLTYNKYVNRKQYQEKVVDALSIVGMESFLNRYPNELSGGQQQRIAIARALVNNPSVLLADEPTGNLDSKNSEIIYDLFARLNDAGKTICLITHDQAHAQLANTLWHINDGVIAQHA